MMADHNDHEATHHPEIEKVPGGLRYRIYDQTGQFVWMTCRDTPDMRRFIEWVRRHDRYGAPEGADA